MNNREIIRAIIFLFKVVSKIYLGIELSTNEFEKLNCPEYYFIFEDDKTEDDLK